MKAFFFSLSLFLSFKCISQSILPPIRAWNGASETLIASAKNPWLTFAEQSGFKNTPNYAETMAWFKKMAAASPLIHMISIGKSAEGRDIFMIIASSEKNVSANALKKSSKALLLAQAGIHAGEIDGKDAGMMLLRDIAFGNKKQLLDNANFLFIPILNVDGHERISPYNRPNQRGPENMGWRTNAENLNINRDFAKIDTKEARAVVGVLNQFDPWLFMDIHVTDGADYQYDITFGGHGKQGYSPAISNWLSKVYKPIVDTELNRNGHIPGQLLFAMNDRDFSEGNLLLLGEPRFSDAYGDLRHTASILVENHSLKPFKQRVLATYVLLESTLRLLANSGKQLKNSTIADRAIRSSPVPMKWKVPQLANSISFEVNSGLIKKGNNTTAPDSLLLLGLESKILKSDITNSNFIQWTAQTKTMKVPNFLGTEQVELIDRPQGYFVPIQYHDIIERLKIHGIKMEVLQKNVNEKVEMYRFREPKFENANGKAEPFEGHVQVNAKTETEVHNHVFQKGSVYISTNQPLGQLAMLLLEPTSPDSFFQWGFLPQIFQRTEYIEAYVIEPMMQKMLADSPDLKIEFEKKKGEEPKFAQDPDAIFSWFYGKSKYYDQSYLLYPIGRKPF